MTEQELLANPPEAASPPLTYLQSRDEEVPELRLLDAENKLWGALPGPTVWGQWLASGIKAKREFFHTDDWEEIK